MDEKNNKRKISILITSVTLVIVLLIGITYAYFSSITSSSARTVQAGTLRIQYETDALNTVRLNNISPIYDNEITTKASKIAFTVTNTGTSNAYVSINLTDIVMDNELKNSDLKWALYSGNTKISDGNFDGASSSMGLIKNEQIASTNSKSYQLYIWISETGTDQSSMMDKNFSAKITVNGSQNQEKPLLTQKIIEDNSPVVTTTPNFANAATTDEGLIKGTDADGDTYYFRGAVQDNYLKIHGLTYGMDMKAYTIVSAEGEDMLNSTSREYLESLCDQAYTEIGYNGDDGATNCKNNIREDIRHHSTDEITFRIVRINGSGTTRLIMDDKIGESAFNNNHDNEKYVGYTYDNGKTCTNESPCSSNTRTSSTIKNYIENWYNTAIVQNQPIYDSVFVAEKFCDDTSVLSVDGNNIAYGVLGRLDTDNNHTPQFTCPDTTKTYGGVYNLKVGLLSADEAVFAGGKYGSSNPSYYLVNPNYGSWWFSISSPSGFYDGYSVESVILLTDGSEKGMIFYNVYHASGAPVNGAVVPVLNLKSDALYSSGSGTSQDPYIVSVN